LLDLNTGRVLASTYTFANGSFEFPGLEAGRYEVVATFGVNEARSRLDLSGDRDVSLNISTPRADKSQGSTVSVSQMKVPGKARKIFDKAMAAFRKAQLDDALSLVQKALGMYPDYAQALTLRGVLNMRKGDNHQAQPDLEKAVELDDSDDMGFVALASLYNNQKRYDEASRILQRGMTLHPDSWQAQMELARAEVGRKNADAALRALAKCEAHVPAEVYYPHLIRAQALIMQKNYQFAVTELEAFLAKEPNGPNSEPARNMLKQLQGHPAAQEPNAQAAGAK
jgi:predicted Zn-dependent protease